MNNIAEKIFKNTSINTFGLITTLLITLFIFTQITLKLGIEGLGMIAIGSLFSILGPVSLLDFGVPGALTREISVLLKNSQVDKARELFWSCLILFFLIGCHFYSPCFFVQLYITKYIFN